MSKEMFKDSFTLLGEEIKRGTSSVLELEVAKLHTRNSIHVPIIVERAKKDGPILLLMGGIHGDEVNGVAIVRKLIREKFHKPKRGTIICIPVFNIFGYLNKSREFPDGRDLNRVFPGSPNGSLASRFAYTFKKEIAPAIDYAIDFHTGGADRANIPQIRCVMEHEETMELARAFDAPFILHSKFIPKSVRETLFKMGKKALLFEGGKSNNLDEDVIDQGVKGAVNVMKYLGMHDGELSEVKNSILIKSSKWIRAPFSGMLHQVVENGVFVKKHTILAVISDPFGEFEKKVKASHDCYIICANSTPIVNRGDALFNVSVELG
jgi:predicted deacylase